MRRARRPSSSPVQLFPFLAVLVSALGALVLLLLAINRQVSLQQMAASFQMLMQQTRAEEATLTGRRRALEQDIAALHTQIAELHGERQTLEQTLQSQDRRLESDAARFRTLQLAATQLHESRSETEARIAAIRHEIAAIQAARQQSTNQQYDPDRTFVPVVHPGANGTARQPIYLECTVRGVTIQPEGVLLSAGLFDLEAGRTMLARAVQSLARYYLERDVGKDVAHAYREWEPYPLLLIRPDGTSLSYAARAALEELEFPFGYELIEADWNLQFPQPDSGARAVLAATLNSVRTNLPGGSSGPRLAHSSFGRPNTASGRIALTPNLGRWLGIEPADTPVSPNAGVPSDGYETLGPEARPEVDAAGISDGRTKGSPPVARAENAATEYSAQDSANPMARNGVPGARGTAAISASSATGGMYPESGAEPAMSSVGALTAESDHSIAMTPGQRRRSVSRGNDQPADALAPRNDPSTVEHADSVPEIANVSLATPSGKTPISRNLEIDCLADGLVIRDRQVFVRVRHPSLLSEVLPTLFEELGNVVTSWGPPGMIFRWQPNLMCLVHPGGLEMYYGLRKALIGSSVTVEHLIAAEDVIDWRETLFLRRLDPVELPTNCSSAFLGRQFDRHSVGLEGRPTELTADRTPE